MPDAAAWIEALGTLAAVLVAVWALRSEGKHNRDALERERQRNGEALRLEQKRNDELQAEHAEIAKERRRRQARLVHIEDVTIDEVYADDLVVGVAQVDQEKRAYGVVIRNVSDEDVTDAVVTIKYGAGIGDPAHRYATGQVDRIMADSSIACTGIAALRELPEGQEGQHSAVEASVIFRDVDDVMWRRSSLDGLQELDATEWTEAREHALDFNLKRGQLTVSKVHNR